MQTVLSSLIDCNEDILMHKGIVYVFLSVHRGLFYIFNMHRNFSHQLTLFPLILSKENMQETRMQISLPIFPCKFIF